MTPVRVLRAGVTVASRYIRAVLYDDVLSALNERAVPYVVVGGIAVVLHGHARLTVDLDLVVDLAVGPAREAIHALVELGFQPRLPVSADDFADPAIRTDWVEHRHLQVFSLYDPVNPVREVDLFATYPLPFDELLAGSTVAVVGSTPVRIASIEHLIAMKEAAGRVRDAADIEALRRLREDSS